LHIRKRIGSLGVMADHFPDWFKKTREKKGLTQTEAAEQLGLSSPTISRWEAGTEPRAGHLSRICDWAPVKPDKLLSLFG
jgi:transcriptional regulator with XRE-family HTH domain